ncbi:MAG TPA: hypothetical protein VD741_03625 [Solirubrobacterales bacterium]|nr:hypothetical protein [Solirubrobacterales bacterium]
MIRKIKALGVALVAVLALAAVLASAASAANYTASSYPTTGTGESALGNDVFKTEAGTVECKVHYQGTIAAASETLTGSSTYSNCKAFGFLSATVNTNGCDATAKAPVGSGDKYTATGNLVCPLGKSIEITAGTCVVAIGNQSSVGTVALVNQTASGDVTVQANLNSIAYTVTKDGIGCPFAGTGAKTGATYTQTNPITVDSTNGANIHVG